jgi:hypothetical protein
MLQMMRGQVYASRQRETVRAGAFAIRRFVVSRPGVWQDNCWMGKVLRPYTNAGIVREQTKLSHRAIALTQPSRPHSLPRSGLVQIPFGPTSGSSAAKYEPRGLAEIRASPSPSLAL